MEDSTLLQLTENFTLRHYHSTESKECSILAIDSSNIVCLLHQEPYMQKCSSTDWWNSPPSAMSLPVCRNDKLALSNKHAMKTQVIEKPNAIKSTANIVKILARGCPQY